MTRLAVAFACSALLGASVAGCKSSSPDAPTADGKGSTVPAGPVTLNAAGSTFVYPMMSKWSSEYQKVAPTVQVNYQSIGSGGGIRQLIAHTVQFGATDGPMTDDQLKEANRPVIHVPLVMGAVVPTYNLPELAHSVRFTPDALAGIFLGDVKTWNDPKIASANADLKLPATPIVVVHRSDGSGTTYVWVDYLSKISPEWKTKVGTATSVNWPVGLGGKGNEGVAGTVRQTPGSIGYVELTYALQNKMPISPIKNQAGSFVEPIDRVGHRRRRGRAVDHPGRSALLDHELARRKGVAGQRHDLGGGLSGHAGRRRPQSGGGFSPLGAARRPGVVRCARLRSAARRARSTRKRKARPARAAALS